MVIDISSLSDLENLAKKVAKNIKGGEVLALSGTLGAGKTTFTKMLLKASGIRKNITSPTFVLMIPYKAKHCTFYHMDLYRIASYKEVAALGVPDLWNKKGQTFVIEWAERIKRHLPKNTIYFNFKTTGESRRVTIKNASKNFEKNISN
jgi:tRNA threonylcarbamoyladenosine biosynthesis protein TsaE